MDTKTLVEQLRVWLANELLGAYWQINPGSAADQGDLKIEQETTYHDSFRYQVVILRKIDNPLPDN